jgi:hypothetical protein
MEITKRMDKQAIENIIRIYEKHIWMLDENTIKEIEEYIKKNKTEKEKEKIMKIIESNIGTKVMFKIKEEVSPEVSLKMVEEYFQKK